MQTGQHGAAHPKPDEQCRCAGQGLAEHTPMPNCWARCCGHSTRQPQGSQGACQSCCTDQMPRLTHRGHVSVLATNMTTAAPSRSGYWCLKAGAPAAPGPRPAAADHKTPWLPRPGVRLPAGPPQTYAGSSRRKHWKCALQRKPCTLERGPAGMRRCGLVTLHATAVGGPSELQSEYKILHPQEVMSLALQRLLGECIVRAGHSSYRSSPRLAGQHPQPTPLLGAGSGWGQSSCCCKLPAHSSVLSAPGTPMPYRSRWHQLAADLCAGS